MKLAPQQNTLQPIPANVQPAASQNVQRTATQADIQTIESVQAAQETAASQHQDTALPMTPPAAGAVNSIILWIAIAIAVVVAAGAIWFWRSF